MISRDEVEKWNKDILVSEYLYCKELNDEKSKEVKELEKENENLKEFGRSCMDILNRMDRDRLPLSKFDVKLHSLQIKSVNLLKQN